MKSKDQQLLEEAYSKVLLKENEELVDPQTFMSDIQKMHKSEYRSSFWIYFGKLTEGERAGQMYALIEASEEYHDGHDSWDTEEWNQLFFNKKDERGYYETSKFLTEEEAKNWEDKSINEFPELNKDIIEKKKYYSEYTLGGAKKNEAV